MREAILKGIQQVTSGGVAGFSATTVTLAKSKGLLPTIGDVEAAIAEAVYTKHGGSKEIGNMLTDSIRADGVTFGRLIFTANDPSISPSSHGFPGVVAHEVAHVAQFVHMYSQAFEPADVDRFLARYRSFSQKNNPFEVLTNATQRNVSSF